MLKTTKLISFNGTSTTADGQVVATMYCSIGENGSVSTGTNIVNQELYESNKVFARADIDEFMQICRAEEDAE